MAIFRSLCSWNLKFSPGSHEGRRWDVLPVFFGVSYRIHVTDMFTYILVIFADFYGINVGK